MSKRDMRPYIIPLAELREWINDAEESLGETECQHRSECAAYGDSWPGACQQIEEGRANVQRLKDAMEWRLQS